MWIRAGGGGVQPMLIIFSFYNIIIKSANVDKGGGGQKLIHKMWIKIRFFLVEPLPKLISHMVGIWVKRMMMDIMQNSVTFFQLRSLNTPILKPI